MLDLIIHGGTVVTPSGAGEWDVGVADGKIALVALPGMLPQDTASRLDATGRIVVPGGVDPHVHTSWTIPTAAAEGLSCGDATQVSRAAVWGGTTTLVDFATWEQGSTLQAALETKEGQWKGESFTDYAYHCIVKGDIPFDVLDEIPDIISAGYPSIKVYMTNATPSRPPQMTDLGHIWAILERTARHGGLLAVHAEDDDIVMFSYKQLKHQGRWGFENVHLAHNKLSEAISFRRVIDLAERTGGAIYLMHVSAADGVEAIAEARSKLLPVYGETLEHYLCFTADDYARPQGAQYHTYPSLKYEEDQAALWHGLRTGSLSTIATDECCTTLAVKLRGDTVDDVTGGHAGAEVRMGVVYSEAVVKRGYSLTDFVNITSAHAARILGMYPRKGAIAPGSDADFALIDPEQRRTIRAADLHETDYSPWEGWEVTGWPVATVLRGKVVLDDGRLHGSPRDGARVPRKIDSSVLSGCRI